MRSKTRVVSTDLDKPGHGKLRLGYGCVICSFAACTQAGPPGDSSAASSGGAPAHSASSDHQVGDAWGGGDPSSAGAGAGGVSFGGDSVMNDAAAGSAGTSSPASGGVRGDDNAGAASGSPNREGTGAEASANPLGGAGGVLVVDGGVGQNPNDRDAPDVGGAAPDAGDSPDGSEPEPQEPEPQLEPDADAKFQLLWQDDFDAVDLTRWSLQTHSWDGNLAQFSADNATASDGILELWLTEAPGGSDKSYSGVEYRSLDSIEFGKVEARVRFAKGSAVVSSLVLLYTPWPPDDWNELDIEYLGRSSRDVQFNHMINIPPADPITGHLQFPELVDLGFDPAGDFHTYAIEWEPGVARFVVDGVVRHEAREEMSRMVLPQNVLLTIWASDSAAWAGAVDSTTAPTSAQYDWLRLYRYVTD